MHSVVPITRRAALRTLGGLGLSACLLSACGGTSATTSAASTASTAAAAPKTTAAATSAAPATTSAAATTAATTARSTTSSASAASAAATSTSTTAAASASAAAKSGAGVTLTAVLRASIDEEKVIGQVFSAFEAQNPGIKVEAIEAPSGHYDEKTDALVAGGAPPALWFPAQNRGYRYYASRNTLMVLDPYISRDKYDLTDFFKVAIDFCKWNGKYVAMPIDLYPQTLIYNKTLFDTAGKTPPTRSFDDKTWNWSAFLDLCQALVRNPGQPTAQYGVVRAWSDLRTYSWINGGDWFEPEGYVSGFPKQFPYQADAVIAGMQFEVDCTYKYHVQPTADEAKALRSTLPTDFHTGKYAMYDAPFMPLKSLGTITSFEWGIAALPNPPSLPRHNTLYPDQWTTFTGQQHPDEAWKLLSFMVSPAGLKIYPTQTGALPSRRSVTDDWKKIVKGYTKLTDDDLNTAIAANDHVQVVASHAVVNFGEIYDKGISPSLSKLTANTTNASTALAAMTPAVKALLTS